MKELNTEIFIAAPIDKVWNELTSFETWKDWNPTVKEVKGSSAIGDKLTITMLANECDEKTYKAEVVECEAPKTFRWRAKMMAGFIFTNDRIFKLEEQDGGTKVTNTEAFSGLMAKMAGSKMDNFVVPILEKMNKALKEKMEGTAKAANDS